MANEPPILPTIREVIGPAKDAIALARPQAASHLDAPGSMYQKVIAGWRGQFARANGRLAAEATAARLGLATGPELTATARSNHDTERNEDPTKAIGEVILYRKVIHVRAGTGTITTSDASDGPSAGTLLTAIAAAMNPHLVSVYSSWTGLGAHQVADASWSYAVIGTSTMGDLVDTANAFLLATNYHFNNKRAADGVALSPAPHLDADTDHQVLLATNPFASDAGASFASNSKASQQSLLVCVNTIKRAINIHFALEAPGGTVRTGMRVIIVADPAAVPPVSAATYAVIADTYIAPGRGSPSQLTGPISVPLEATSAGSASNQPFFTDHNPVVNVQGSLFDAAQTYHLAPLLLRAAGGGPGQSDRLLRQAAAATWRGSFGPTADALLAGALRSAGVAHYAMLDDTATGRAYVYPTDESWAQSATWLLKIKQELLNEWLGTGQRLGMQTVINQVIRVRLTVVLRDSRYLADPSAITAAIKAAIKSYFDERPDWYTWKTTSLKGRCVAADRIKILKISEAAVMDVNGVPLTEPSTPTAGGLLTHWRFEDNALDVTYDAPS